MKRNGFLVVVAVVAIAPAAICRAAPAEGKRAQIVVRLEKDLGPTNRRVLGTNVLAYQDTHERYGKYGAGMWDGDRHRPNAAMVAFAKGAGATTLRWPGGCKVHYYNWKRTVGPRQDRPDQRFGLGEFITLCQAVGAEPIITLSGFWGTPADAADMVEYLNAPLGANPTGGKDWAKVRAADGHAGPLGVVWFEYGNETNHGGHKRFGGPTLDRYMPGQYATKFLAYRKAMRAVDPKVKLGAVLENHGWPQDSPWTDTVLRQTGAVADFYIHHAYLPRFSRNDGQPSAAELYRIAFASTRQFDHFYRALNARIRRLAGREVPLAITEYNGHFVQSKPTPYRLCLGTAVQVADLIRVLIRPEHNIDNAQYWQFANEYWGAIRGYAAPYVRRPAWYVFSLYHQHLQPRLVAADVTCGSYETDGGYGVRAAKAAPQEFAWLGEEVALAGTWQLGKTPAATMRVDKDGALAVEITTDREANFYHAQLSMPARPDTGYRVWAELRTEGLSKRGAQVQVGDDRGWPVTRSASLSAPVLGPEWQTVSVDYATLKDTKGIQIVARRLEGGAERGKLWIRNVRGRPFRPHRLGAVPELGVLASAGKQAISVFIVNRRITRRAGVRIQAAGTSGKAWCLTGPGVDATNEKNPKNVGVIELPVRIEGDGAHVILPPHSFTAVRLNR